MLTMYYRDDEHIPFTEENIIRDVEVYFDKVVLSGTDYQKKIIKAIENGEYLDEFNFLDRFGIKLSMSNLSTGCKAALCIDWYRDKLVDLSECGNSAINQILINCKYGNILLDDRGIDLLIRDNSISINLDGNVFNSLRILNLYIKNRGLMTYKEVVKYARGQNF